MHAALLSAGTQQAADLAEPSHITWGLHTPHSIDVNVFDEGLQLHILTHHLVALIVEVNHILCKPADTGTIEQDKMKRRKQDCNSLQTFYWPCRGGRCCTVKKRRARAGLSTLLPPSHEQWECKEATLINFWLQHHFLPQQKVAGPHTAYPEQSCALYSLVWGFAPDWISVLTRTSLPSLNTDSLWHIHMCLTLGTGAPKLGYQHQLLYVRYCKAVPEYNSNSSSPPTTHPFHKTKVAHSKVGVAQETSLGEKRSRTFSYTHCIQQTSPCSVPLLKNPSFYTSFPG